MTARTHAKKTSPAKKSSAKKTARPAKRAKKHSNGAMAKAQMFEAQAKRDHKRGEGAKLLQQMREKDDLLVLGQQRISALEIELEQARSNDRPAAALEAQLRELQARFTTQKVELEASRAETANLREAVSKVRGPGEALRCPRCGNKMSEQLVDQVRAERCSSCQGIFFDNGELEQVIRRHDEHRASGGKSWFSGIFGKKN
jgi:hypothetical protein